MKLLKSRAAAVVVLVAAIVLASLYGLSKQPAVEAPEGGPKLDTSLSTSFYEDFIVDSANVLSSKTEKNLCVYNANWDALDSCIMGVVTVRNAGSDIEDAAWDWFDDLELGGDDALLIFDTGTQDSYVVASGKFYDRFDSQSVSFVDNCLVEYVRKGDYDGAALNLFGQVHPLFGNSGGNGGSFRSSGGSMAGAIILIVVLVIFLAVISSTLDSIRYSSWRRRYGGMAAPPVLFRPILWWHRPGSSWYRRRSAPPPPPPPRPGPRPPMGGGMPRPPMGGGMPRPPMGGSRPGAGPRPPSPPRSGGFGGGGRSSSPGGSGRRGGFGGGSRGGRPSGGSGRSGGFGGGRRR